MKTLKGFTVQQLGAIAVFFVIAAITLSVGGQILDDLAIQQCEDVYNATWIGIHANASTGCCVGYDATTGEGIVCANNTQGLGQDFNTTLKGLEGMETFGSWLPPLALVIAAAVVVGILIRYLGGVASGA